MELEFNSVFGLVDLYPDEQSCIDYLEERRWGGNVISPFDPTSIVYKCKNNRYRCKNTGKYFNVRTNTLFDNSKVDLRKWFMGIYLTTGHKKGISSHQLARDIHVTQKTAWFMLHRMRNCFGEECIECLQNEVEADETYIGGKNKNRHKNKKVENSQGRSVKDKTPVFGMIERDGLVVAQVVPDTKANTLTPVISKCVEKGSSVYTDEWKAYVLLHILFNHEVVLHNEGRYVIGRAHTNTIEGFWSHLKRMILGIHHWVSPKHLQLYVDGQAYRYNTRRISESRRFILYAACFCA
ncbi:DDE transposase [Bacteroidia bacterium]|nr:DDE transposase [Bacteroidia bacterium]